MKFEILKLPEPLLEFGGQFKSPIVKDALLSGCGPYESNFYSSIKTIRLGLVTLPQELDAVCSWVDSLGGSLVSDESNIKRYREFAGTESILKARFELDERFVRTINVRDYELIQSLNVRDKFEALLKLYGDKVASMCGDNRPDCILVNFPEEVANFRIVNTRLSEEERRFLESVQESDGILQLQLFETTPEQKKLAQELLPQAEELLFRNFHRALKARCMAIENGVPIQVLRRHTYVRDSTSQSASTIAWNITMALYYKATNIPWRLADIPQDTCFVGISFHYMKRRGNQMVYSSVAQAFSSSGEGFALKGTSIPRDQKRDKKPYLKAGEAAQLINDVIEFYSKRVGNSPSRIVVHKTSRFQPEEEEGITHATSGKVSDCELVWFSPTGFRLLKRGYQPPDRGTLCSFDRREFYLFTTGYVRQWNEYPGPHIPSPIELGLTKAHSSEQAAKEILALTKMNWNSADGLGRHPITISFARRVGIIMTEMDDDTIPNPSYRFYM